MEVLFGGEDLDDIDTFSVPKEQCKVRTPTGDSSLNSTPEDRQKQLELKEKFNSSNVEGKDKDQVGSNFSNRYDNYTAIADSTGANQNMRNSESVSGRDPEPTFFRLMLPFGTVIAILVKLDYLERSSSWVLLIMIVWIYSCAISVAAIIGLGGGRGQSISLVSGLSLMVTILWIVFAVIGELADTGSGDYLFDDCIDVGRFGEVQCG